MANIFPRYTNWLPIKILVCLTVVAASVVSGMAYYFTPKYTRVGYQPTQPVAFDHSLHVNQLGMDCRYCHTGVELSSSANIPPIETCMGCHSQVLSKSTKLEFIRSSYTEDVPVQWNLVHDVPKFVYFNHSIHVAKGVGCSTCHGNLATMPVVYKTQALYMSWCLNCHRNPEQFLRPESEIYNPAWQPPADQIAQGLILKQKYNIRSKLQLTNCSICHR
jgi:hypothetical protein